MKKFLLVLIVALSLYINITNTFVSHVVKENELLFYVGITMIQPMEELAIEFEKLYNCKISLLQGGSQDLYDSITSSKEGDLYLPGSKSYRDLNLAEGYLEDFVLVGYNRASLIVAKGNPKNISSNIRELIRTDLSIVIGNPDTGSIGRETKKILQNVDIYDDIYNKALYLTTDSIDLTNAIISKDADVIINWQATSQWDSNADFLESISIDETIAPKKSLLCNLLSFSEHKDLTLQFMAYASSEHGNSVFRKYGFLDADELLMMKKGYLE